MRTPQKVQMPRSALYSVLVVTLAMLDAFSPSAVAAETAQELVSQCARVAAAPSGLYRTAANVRDKLDASWAVVPRGDGLQGVQQYGLQTEKNGDVTTAPELNTSTNSANAGDAKVGVESPDPATTTVD